MEGGMKSYVAGMYLCVIMLLVGCSFIPAKFNGTEYTNIVKIATMVNTPNCEVSQVVRLKDQSLFTKNYAQHLPNNEDTFHSLQEIDASVDALLLRVRTEPVSATYCKMKHINIELMTHTLLDAVGRKPR
jgi:hypothetical protein